MRQILYCEKKIPLLTVTYLVYHLVLLKVNLLFCACYINIAKYFQYSLNSFMTILFINPRCIKDTLVHKMHRN